MPSLTALLLLACDRGPEPVAAAALPEPTPQVDQAPAWPSLEVPVLRRPIRVTDRRKKRIYLDAGHGAHKNPGNTSAACLPEQEHALHVAEAVRDVLLTVPGVEVKVSRSGDSLRGYQARVDEANAWGADVFLSFHSDARGRFWWGPEGCPRGDGAPGFAVLWNRSGTLGDARLALARDLAREIQGAGIPAYNGEDYEGAYDSDDIADGVFRDRRGLLVLRRPTMPSVIIETHHALDEHENARWVHDPEVLAAFAEAIALALAGAPPG